jgi:hypothetical protein
MDTPSLVVSHTQPSLRRRRLAQAEAPTTATAPTKNPPRPYVMIQTYPATDPQIHPWLGLWRVNAFLSYSIGWW